MITGFLHSGFTVADIDRSVDWYTDVLGLELVRRQRNDNAYTRTIVGMPDAVLEVAFLAVPSTTGRPAKPIVELMQYLAPDGGTPDLTTADVGVGHLALIVDDLREHHRRMVARGVRFRNDPVRISEGVNVGALACYLLDPDGITIELMQQPER